MWRLLMWSRVRRMVWRLRARCWRWCAVLRVPRCLFSLSFLAVFSRCLVKISFLDNFSRCYITLSLALFASRCAACCPFWVCFRLLVVALLVPLLYCLIWLPRHLSCVFPWVLWLSMASYICVCRCRAIQWIELYGIIMLDHVTPILGLCAECFQPLRGPLANLFGAWKLAQDLDSLDTLDELLRT